MCPTHTTGGSEGPVVNHSTAAAPKWVFGGDFVPSHSCQGIPQPLNPLFALANFQRSTAPEEFERWWE
eukprot:2340232-Prorocentrum_lima.AAC.1